MLEGISGVFPVAGRAPEIHGWMPLRFHPVVRCVSRSQLPWANSSFCSSVSAASSTKVRPAPPGRY